MIAGAKLLFSRLRQGWLKMKNTLPDKLSHELECLGVTLNPPAAEELIETLVIRCGGSLHPDIINLYQTFNGFANEDFDALSMVGIWTIERIVSTEDSYYQNEMMPFADFCLDLDVYCCSRSNPTLPVYSANRRMYRTISSSYYDFWARLITGSLM